MANPALLTIMSTILLLLPEAAPAQHVPSPPRMVSEAIVAVPEPIAGTEYSLETIVVANPIAPRLATIAPGLVDTGPAGIPSHRLIAVPPAHRSVEGLVHLIRRIVAVDAGSYASPILDVEGGGFRYPLPGLIAAPRAGFPERPAGWSRPWSCLSLVERRSDLRSGFEVLDRCRELERSGLFEFVQPDWVCRVDELVVPDDPILSSQWHLIGTNGMNAQGAWNIALGDPGIVTVILDDGVDVDHPDLSYLTGVGADFTGNPGANGGRHVHPDDDHGTLVAGCVAATTDNALGVASLAGNTRIVSAKIAIDDVPGPMITLQTSWVVSALAWSSSIGARITNSSFGDPIYDQALATAYAQTAMAGMLHFGAAGNDGIATVSFPANAPHVHAISATDMNGGLAFFSSFGPEIELACPGRTIWTTDRVGAPGYSTGDYRSVGGTSLSSPLAAGLAALVWSINPSLTADQVMTILRQTAVDLGPVGKDPQFGHGRPDAAAAAAAAESSLPSGIGGVVPPARTSPRDDEMFGAACADLGDLDGDSISDFAIGAPGGTGPSALASGLVEIRSGADLTVLAVLEGDAAGDGFGSSITTLGDIDGDGTDEFAIGAPGTTNGGPGFVRIFTGGPAPSALTTVVGGSPGGAFGAAIAGAADWNDDGFADLAIGAPGQDLVEIRFGPGFTTSASLTGLAAGSVFGTSLTFVDDLDGNGLREIVIGAPAAPTIPGSIEIFEWSGSAPVRTSTIGGGIPGDGFGSSIVALPDHNGDGLPEIAVGAPDDGAGSIALITSPVATLTQPLSGTVADGRFGAALMVPGDIDGDGLAELVVGAPAEADGGGRVHVIDGATFAPLDVRTWEGRGAWGTTVAGISSVNGNGFVRFVAGAPQAHHPDPDAGAVAVVTLVEGPFLGPAANPHEDGLQTRDDRLTVDGSAGGILRRVEVSLGSAFTIACEGTPQDAVVVWGHVGTPWPFGAYPIAGFGEIAFPPADADPASPALFTLASNVALTVPPLVPIGVPFALPVGGYLPPMELALQGLVFSAGRAIVTNGVLIRIG